MVPEERVHARREQRDGAAQDLNPGHLRRAAAGRFAVALAAGAASIAMATAAMAHKGGSGSLVETTLDDYFLRGTQPETDPVAFEPILTSTNCTFCHSDYDPVDEPYAPWVASMMGQSARDPLFYACLDVANLDATDAGEFCIRCHAPRAFLGDRAVPTDGTGFESGDFDGINCNFCHRLVNPKFPVPGDGPPPDHQILKDLQTLDLIPLEGSNARYVVDPIDSRRGPFDDVPQNLHVGVEILVSPVHQKSELCWTCHDVSNPLFVRQPDGTYQLDPLATPHSTGSQRDMFPLHRTYSEWKNSYYFTLAGVQHNGRFGGNHIDNPDFIADGTAGVMATCQDCHMPDQFGQGCVFGAPFFPREDLPQHSFMGSNTWMLDAIRLVDYDGDGEPDFPDSETGLTDERVAAAIARNVGMLESASDLQLLQLGSGLRVRIINHTGHKLPTGFPDGRRMWINVKFLDGDAQVIAEHGGYDFATADLDTGSTKVYEVLLALSADMAATTGLPQGQTFHFMLADQTIKDNRIPPTGHSNTVAAIEQTAPVGATYADGQHWDDTTFEVPHCAQEAVVTVYYQLLSKEYVAFLRDNNPNPAPNRGTIMYDLWEQLGMSSPVVMDMASIPVVQTGDPADLDDDGLVGTSDLLTLLSVWGPCPGSPCVGDIDCDGQVGTSDLLALLDGWG